MVELTDQLVRATSVDMQHWRPRYGRPPARLPARALVADSAFQVRERGRRGNSDGYDYDARDMLRNVSGFEVLAAWGRKSAESAATADAAQPEPEDAAEHGEGGHNGHGTEAD